MDNSRQIISDSISKMMGSLSHLRYRLYFIDKECPKIFKFQIKQWYGKFDKQFTKHIDATDNDISVKYPEFSNILDRSFLYLDYFITHRKMIQVSDINKLFNVFDSDKKLYMSIINKINKSALKTEIKFRPTDYRYLCSIYLNLLMVKHSIDSCLDKTPIFCTKEFKNEINKGLDLFGNLIDKSDIDYYTKACNAVFNHDIDLHTLFSVADLALANHHDSKALFGIIKDKTTA